MERSTDRRLTIEKKGDILQAIRKNGADAQQGRDTVQNMIAQKASRQNMLRSISELGVEKEAGRRSVEQLFAAKSSKTGVMDGIRSINKEIANNNQNVV